MGCIVSSPVAEEDGHGDDEVGLQVERSQGTAMAPVERIFSLSLRHSARPKLEARSRELGLDGTCQSDPSEILQVRIRRTQRALFRRVAAACALARALLHTLALRLMSARPRAHHQTTTGVAGVAFQTRAAVAIIDPDHPPSSPTPTPQNST